MVDENKAVVLRYVEAWNTGDLLALDEVLAPDFVDYMPGRSRNRDALKQDVIRMRTAFPDFHASVEDLVAEGDKVAARVIYRGTHGGELRRGDIIVPPTGNRATWSGMFIARIANGKTAEGWGEVDSLGMLRQLGVSATSHRTDGSHVTAETLRA